MSAKINIPLAIADIDVKRSEEHTSELQSHSDLVCRLLLEKKKILRRFCPAIYFGDALPVLPIIVLLHLTLLLSFNFSPTTHISTLSLHDALPISYRGQKPLQSVADRTSHQCRRR